MDDLDTIALFNLLSRVLPESHEACQNVRVMRNHLHEACRNARIMRNCFSHTGFSDDYFSNDFGDAVAEINNKE